MKIEFNTRERLDKLEKFIIAVDGLTPLMPKDVDHKLFISMLWKLYCEEFDRIVLMGFDEDLSYLQN
tara:strand:- start:165 stop:365 length:201 start_codon:yes stop_codon:yes gene_type:complete